MLWNLCLSTSLQQKELEGMKIFSLEFLPCRISTHYGSDACQ